MEIIFQCFAFKAKTKLKGYSDKVVIDGRNNFKSQKSFNQVLTRRNESVILVILFPSRTSLFHVYQCIFLFCFLNWQLKRFPILKKNCEEVKVKNIFLI